MGHKKHLNLLNTLILGLFLVEFIFGGISRGRYGLIVQAIVKFAIIILGYLIIFGKHAILKKPFAVKIDHQIIFVALLLWVSISILSALSGIYNGNDHNYIVGDLYKFLMLPGLFLLFYFGIKSERDIEFILNGMVVIHTLFISYYLILYFTASLSMYTLSPSAQNIQLTLPILLCTFSMGKKRLIKLFALLAIVQIPFLAYFTQSLGLIINILFITAVFLIIRYKISIMKVLIMVGIFSICILPFFYQITRGDLFVSLRDYILRSHPAQQHVLVKTQILLRAKQSSILEKSELLSGGRLSQFIDIYKYFSDNPKKLITGSGMGGYLMKHAAIVFKKSWVGPAHFIESPFGEVIFRAGLPGLIAFLYFIMLFVKKAFFLYKTNKIHPFGILSLVFGVQLVANYVMGSFLSAPYLILCLLFVGVLIFEKKQHEILGERQTLT